MNKFNLCIMISCLALAFAMILAPGCDRSEEQQPVHQFEHHPEPAEPAFDYQQEQSEHVPFQAPEQPPVGFDEPQEQPDRNW